MIIVTFSSRSGNEYFLWEPYETLGFQFSFTHYSWRLLHHRFFLLLSGLPRIVLVKVSRTLEKSQVRDVNSTCNSLKRGTSCYTRIIFSARGAFGLWDDGRCYSYKGGHLSFKVFHYKVIESGHLALVRRSLGDILSLSKPCWNVTKIDMSSFQKWHQLLFHKMYG